MGAKVDLDFSLKNSMFNEINKQCQRLDYFVKNTFKDKDVEIRLLKNNQELEELSDLRKKVYSEKNESIFHGYKEKLFLDEYDVDSYIFSFFSEGKMTASQRVRFYPFEVGHYVNNNDITAFLGEGLENDYIEYSRLAVDNTPGIRSRMVAHCLALVSSTSIILSTGIRNAITYTKPRMSRKNISFSNDTLEFYIKERDHNYLLFKVDMFQDMIKRLNLAVDSEEEAIDILDERVNNKQSI